MSDAVLYDYWRSTASWRVRIALNLAEIAYTSVPVDLVAGDQWGAAHFDRNPQRLVPVLEIDRRRLTQSMAILDYLEDTGRTTLRPANPGDCAAMRAVVQSIACDIHPVCNLRVAAHAVKIAGTEEARAEWMRHFIRLGLEAVEEMLSAEGPYATGAKMTQADLFVVPQLYNARRWGAEIGDLPRLARVDTACGSLDAFARAAPEVVKPAG